MIVGAGRAGSVEAHLGTAMPRFYIDTSDQARFVHDQEGLEFEDVEAAKDAAVDALPDMARDVLPDGDSRTFIAVVRDEKGRTLLQATMSFSVTWMCDH